MIACGTLALFFSGGVIPALALCFAVALIIAWKLEGTRWQLSPRVSLSIVLISLPLFYLDWRFQPAGSTNANDWIGVGALTHLILFLSLIKLLQVKADRDWLFLYLISFFEILLSAGLSISPSFLLVLCLYTFWSLSTIICFEIQKARRLASPLEIKQLTVLEPTWLRRHLKIKDRLKFSESRPLSLAAFALLAFILILALPIFLIAPRFTSGALARNGESLSGFVGFSDHVSLGSIGKLQLNDRIVMRVKLDSSPIAQQQQLRWRGVALDAFDGHDWRKTLPTLENAPLEKGFYRLDSIKSLDRLTTQTFYLEPIETSVLFAAPSVIALQGNTLPFVRADREGSLSTRDHSLERISYRVYSDTIEPPIEQLQADRKSYDAASARYMQLPDDLDPRIRALARDIVRTSGAQNRYDQAKAIENYLREKLGYSLEMRADPKDPVASFLFDIKKGHCEYFSTSMALMLRTQGIASRVVNGFQMGDYNDAADAYIVRQFHAHSWVEAYFPGADAWITFDPTPAAGQFSEQSGGGLTGSMRKYAEAFELLWIQYVVAYDRQEQSSLAGSLRDKFGSYQRASFQVADELRAQLSAWWQRQRKQDAHKSEGFYPAISRIALLVIFLAILAILFWLLRRIQQNGWRAILPWRKINPQTSVVIFYERLTRALEARGFKRSPAETPLEFAGAVGLPEALLITKAYNQVRYGAHKLSAQEIERIENFLRQLETT